jgi:hypothetical protein
VEELLVHVSSQEVATPRDALDKIAVAAESLAHACHLEAQVALFHYGRGPYLLDDDLLRDQRTTGLSQND